MTMGAHVVAGMPREKPLSRDEWRNVFFAAIDDNAGIFEGDLEEGDVIRRLPQNSIDVLKRTELLKLKLPAALGGAEADNALQFEVYERLAYHNAAVAWCYFIACDQIGRAGALLPNEGVAVIFEKGLPLMCGSGGIGSAKVVPAEGGYFITGRFGYGSGISGSQWTSVVVATGADPATPELKVCIVPTESVHNTDNWNTLGLRGTGSSDFQLDHVFVPHALTYDFHPKPLRGGAVYRLGTMGYVGHTVPAVALGAARRALDDITNIAKEKVRGFSKRSALAHRSVFQAFIGEADVKLRAARQLMLENGERIVAEAAKVKDTSRIEAEVRAAGCYATTVALDVVNTIIRFAGGDAIRHDSRMARALRDVHVAATHICVNNTSLEEHAKFMMGLDDATSMA